MLHPDAELVGEETYPVTSEKVAAEYGDQRLDLPNETETPGSVLDRVVDERFDSPQERHEAVDSEVTGEAGGPEEYNDERPLEELDEESADDLADSGGTDT